MNTFVLLFAHVRSSVQVPIAIIIAVPVLSEPHVADPPGVLPQKAVFNQSRSDLEKERRDRSFQRFQQAGARCPLRAGLKASGHKRDGDIALHLLIGQRRFQATRS